jgi:hypothetical protein
MENSPIVLRRDRTKLTFLLVLIVTFALLFYWTIWSGVSKNLFWGYMGAVLFGAGALAVALQLYRPSTLTLDKNGLTWQVSWRTLKYEWSDFTQFMVFSPRWPVQHVGCLFSESYRNRHNSAALTGGVGSFGGSWERPVPEIVDLLNSARMAWGKSD